MFVARYWRTKSHLYRLTGVRHHDGNISIVPRPEMTESDRVQISEFDKPGTPVAVVINKH